jgi:hypothetical protein
LDVDVNDVDVRGARLDLASDLRDLRSFFQAEGIPFGIIFWSGHDPEPTDISFFNHVMDWVRRVRAAIGKPDQSIFQSWVRRSSITCNGQIRCDSANNLKCSSADPEYCGKRSVPINLPESDATVFSHTRLINEALSVLDMP